MSAPSPTRVAIRHLAREYQPQQVAQTNQNFKEKVRKFDLEVSAAVPRDLERAWNVYNASLQGSWRWLVYWGKDVALWVVETRSIPAGRAKAVELAARVFLAANIRRPPRDVLAWWEKNAKAATLLLDAMSWPEKADSVEDGGVREKFPVGSFTVHNTLHLDGAKLDGVVDVLEATVQKIRGAQPSSLARVLYGDVFVVGQIRQSKTLAWYYLDDDTVYLRPHLKVGRGEVHNLIHELGHRYWYKFLSSTAKREWNTTFFLMKNTGTPRAPLPKVGEPINLPFKGRTEPPIVEAIVGGRGGPQYQLVGGGYVSLSAVHKALTSLAITEKFPTPYAATSAEEYFAEAFAFHVLGTLDEAHEAKFNDALRA